MFLYAIVHYQLITKLYFFHQHHNYQKECAYLFFISIDHVISDMCMFLRREIFNAQGRLFNKKDLVFKLQSLLIYLETTWILMIDVVNKHLTIKFLMLWMWTVNSSDVVWIILWMSCLYITVNSEFEKYTGFIANLNTIFLNLYKTQWCRSS
jgi:hypothetical protein